MWPWRKKSESEKELAAFGLFAGGNTLIDVAQELKVNVEAAKEYHKKWVRAKSDEQLKSYNMFSKSKDLMEVSTELGITMDAVSEHYRSYLRYQKRQEEIQKEVNDEQGKSKRFTSPYFVYKMIKNPFTGHGYTAERCPNSWDEPPTRWIEFEEFTRNNGDGDYIIVDADDKRVGKIKVFGMGFKDPTELDEFGFGADGYQSGRMGRMMRGGRRGFGGGGGAVPLVEDPYSPMHSGNPQDRGAEMVLGSDMRQKDIYIRAAEIATDRGQVDLAVGYLKKVEHMGMPVEGKTSKGFLDELLDASSDTKKLELLQKLFGKESVPETKDAELERVNAYGGMVKEMLPALKENIIDPIAENIAGENQSVTQLQQEAGVRGGGGNVGGSRWKEQKRIGGRQKPPAMALQRDRRGMLEESGAMDEESQSVPYVPSEQVQQRVEMHDEFTESGDSSEDEMGELQEADDYGEVITENDLRSTKAVEEESNVGGDYKLSIDEKWMLNKGFPRFKKTITLWRDATGEEGKSTKVAFSPERIAREDHHTMAKSSYAVFFGKRRLLKAYHAAKTGPKKMIGHHKHYVEKELNAAIRNGMDATAERLREMGISAFRKVWEPPKGLSMGNAIKKLLKYVILKDCWAVFNSDAGTEWFDRYCKEFVRAVEEDSKGDEKRKKIAGMLTRGERKGGENDDMGEDERRKSTGTTVTGRTDTSEESKTVETNDRSVAGAGPAESGQVDSTRQEVDTGTN